MKLGRGKVPPGGWHFEAGSGVRLTAITEELLTKQIYEYRLRNNIPPGDIERDIDDYYCSKYPDACHKEASDYQPAMNLPRDAPIQPISNRIAQWVSGLITRLPRGGFGLAPSAEVNRRAAICVACPGNREWRLGCKGCTNNIASLSIQLRQLRTTPHDNQLLACTYGGWDNGSAVHLSSPELPLSDGQKTQLPDRCWRKAM